VGFETKIFCNLFSGRLFQCILLIGLVNVQLKNDSGNQFSKHQRNQRKRFMLTK